MATLFEAYVTNARKVQAEGQLGGMKHIRNFPTNRPGGGRLS